MAPQQTTATTQTRPNKGPRGGGPTSGLVDALHDIRGRLDADVLSVGERMRLLQRQAELGDLRDELALRERRRAAAARR